MPKLGVLGVQRRRGVPVPVPVRGGGGARHRRLGRGSSLARDHRYAGREEFVKLGRGEGGGGGLRRGRVLPQHLVRALTKQKRELLAVGLAGAPLAPVGGGAVGGGGLPEEIVVEGELLARALVHGTLVGAARDEAVDAHLLRLADAVAPRHALHVVLRVPVRVVQNDRVGGGQVDADAARSGGEEEGEGRRGVARLEAVDGRLARLLLRRAVEALVPAHGHVARGTWRVSMWHVACAVWRVACGMCCVACGLLHVACGVCVRQRGEGEVVFEEVEHPVHLREDEHLAPLVA